MQNLLRNKVIAITGSSSGIGRAIAARYAPQGATVALHHLGTSQTKRDAEALRDELPVPQPLDGQPSSHLIIGVDITAEGAASSIIGKTVSAFGRIDALVNNAGICKFEPALSVTKSLLSNHMDVNYMAAYLLTQAATSQMIKQGHGGSVVSIASITAMMGSANLTHYAPTKGALLSMSKSFAAEFGKHGIRYNCVLPGTIQTAMNQEDLKKSGKKDLMESRVPLGRLGDPDDLAGAVMFFASDLSSYVSGEQVMVDGGASIFYR